MVSLTNPRKFSPSKVSPLYGTTIITATSMWCSYRCHYGVDLPMYRTIILCILISWTKNINQLLFQSQLHGIVNDEHVHYLSSKGFFLVLSLSLSLSFPPPPPAFPHSLPISLSHISSHLLLISYNSTHHPTTHSWHSTHPCIYDATKPSQSHRLTLISLIKPHARWSSEDNGWSLSSSPHQRNRQ